MKKIPIYLFIVLFGLCGHAFAAEQWNEKKDMHFIVYYKGAPIDFVETVIQSAEREYNDIARNLGFTRYKSWTFDERAKIYIYDSDKDYVQSAQTAQWSHGIASPTERIIRTFPTAHGFFDSTLPHELGHIIFREFIGFKAEVPLWFEEGVAMYQEKAKRWGAHTAVKDSIKEGRFISLMDLTNLRLYSNSDPRLVDLFYAEAASAVNFLINESGQERFVRLCRELKEGNNFEKAFASVYIRYQTLERLNKSWLESLK